MEWYIVHTYSGFEERVAETLRQRAEALDMGDKFGEVRIPTETIDLVRRAQRGDDDALNRLIDRYYDRIQRIVRIRLGPRLRRDLEKLRDRLDRLADGWW